MAVVAVRASYGLTERAPWPVRAAGDRAERRLRGRPAPHAAAAGERPRRLPPYADVTVLGSAHAPGGRPAASWEVCSAWGMPARICACTGRGFGAGGSSWRLGPAEPAARVPLDYRLSVGGGSSAIRRAGAARTTRSARGCCTGTGARRAGRCGRRRSRRWTRRRPTVRGAGASRVRPGAAVLAWRERRCGTRDEAWARARCPQMPEAFDYRFFRWRRRGSWSAASPLARG